MSSDNWRLIGVLVLGSLLLWILRAVLLYRLTRPRSTARLTSYPTLDLWKRYIDGSATLQEWRDYKGPTIVTEEIELDKPAYFTGSFLGARLVWGAPVELTVYGRRRAVVMGKWYSISIWHLNLLWFKSRGGNAHVFREGPDRRGGSKDAPALEPLDRPSDPGDSD